MTNYSGIQNYFEPLVIECISQLMAGRPEARDDDFLEDVACVALNRLSPHYVRYRVDAAFYLSTKERNEIDRQVDAAVIEAIDFVVHHRRMKGEEGE